MDVHARSFAAEPVAGLRLRLLLPALVAIAYPWLLSGVTASLGAMGIAAPPSPDVTAATVVVILLAAGAVMATGAVFALRLGRSAEARPAYALAHLAFAAPSLLVGFGNVAGVLQARGAVAYAWPLFWALAAGAVMAAPSAAPAGDATRGRRLGLAHGLSAVAILVLFLAPHIANHLSGVWTGAAHLAVMDAVRHLYRGAIVEPVLLALVAFQIASGFTLAERRARAPRDGFGTVQTLTGVYVGVFILAHVTAVFAARSHGTDTNWNWLTYDDDGLLSRLNSFALVGHYVAGPIALLTHLGCGLRMVMLEHRAAPAAADRAVWVMAGLGVAASALILAGLLGVHLG